MLNYNRVSLVSVFVRYLGVRQKTSLDSNVSLVEDSEDLNQPIPAPDPYRMDCVLDACSPRPSRANNGTTRSVLANGSF